MPAPGAIALEFLAEIAVGATARVDLCRALGPEYGGRLVAVKRLHPDLAEDPAFATRFLDEVWMTAALKHPNVVEVAGWGTDSQGTYLAVELVQGVSLARLMKTVVETGEAFTERMVVYIGRCLCRGLAAAHSLRSARGELLQLVHRDLSADNVLVGFNGDVKIADFGLAKAKERLTRTTLGLSGRPPVQMAPEEVHGHGVDHRVDLFSLGALLFELLVGRPPWVGSSMIATLQLIVNQRPPDLRDLRPKMDRTIISVVMGCLEKDPSMRPQSAGLILDRLDTWLVAHGYRDDNAEALGRFVRRNAMRQMRWFERAVSGVVPPTPYRLIPPKLPRHEPSILASRSAATIVDRKIGAGTEAGASHATQAGAPAFTESGAHVAPRQDRAGSDPAVSEDWTEEDAESDDTTTVQKRDSIPFDGPLTRVGPSGLPAPNESPTFAGGAEAAPRSFSDALVGPAPVDARAPKLPTTRPHASEPGGSPKLRATAPHAGTPGTAVPCVDAEELMEISLSPPSSDELDSGEGPTIALRRKPLVPAGPRPPMRVIPNAPVPTRIAARMASLAAAPSARAAPPPTRETLALEAQRLRALAAERADGARAAATQARLAAEEAERAAGIAKLTEEAAAIAKEAVDIAGTKGLTEASRHFERVRALEVSIGALEAPRPAPDPNVARRRDR